jgi:hypothetical protein
MALTLERSRGAVILSRNDVDRALAESNTRSTADISDASALQIGRKLGAQFMVTGVLEKTGETYRLRTKMLSASSNRMEVSTTANVKDSPLVQQLIPRAQPVVTPAPAPAVTPTPRPAPAPAVTPASRPAPAPAAPASPGAYKIGDTGPAGGLIFYDKGNNNNGWRYLEAAPVEAEFRATKWSVHGTVVETTQQGIGSGRRNTQLIVEKFKQTSGEWDTAAQKADDLAYNGFNDWFLPSQAELDQIYGNLKRRNLGDFKNEWYWSSTQHISSTGYAHDQNFNNGAMDYNGKTYSRYVRPIRQVPGQ